MEQTRQAEILDRILLSLIGNKKRRRQGQYDQARDCAKVRLSVA
jgi:hypothetical protein